MVGMHYSPHLLFLKPDLLGLHVPEFWKLQKFFFLFLFWFFVKLFSASLEKIVNHPVPWTPVLLRVLPPEQLGTRLITLLPNYGKFENLISKLETNQKLARFSVEPVNPFRV
jgi:hypothetical protein